MYFRLPDWYIKVLQHEWQDHNVCSPNQILCLLYCSLPANFKHEIIMLIAGPETSSWRCSFWHRSNLQEIRFVIFAGSNFTMETAKTSAWIEHLELSVVSSHRFVFVMCFPSEFNWRIWSWWFNWIYPECFVRSQKSACRIKVNQTIIYLF